MRNGYLSSRCVRQTCVCCQCINPLPLDRLYCHAVAAVRSWPSTDRRHILAVAIRDSCVAHQNLAELQLCSCGHAARVASCASADDDTLTLMSAELLPRLEGGSGQPWKRSTTYELYEFYGRTHKLELYVWVSGHPVTLLIE